MLWPGRWGAQCPEALGRPGDAPAAAGAAFRPGGRCSEASGGPAASTGPGAPCCCEV